MNYFPNTKLAPKHKLYHSEPENTKQECGTKKTGVAVITMSHAWKVQRH